MTIYIKLEDGSHGVIKQEGEPIEGKILLEAFVGIVNDDTFEYDQNKNTTCQITGFKVKHSTLLEQWNNALVRPESYSHRNIQDFVRVHSEELKGPIRPEPASDTFISTSISPEDL